MELFSGVRVLIFPRKVSISSRLARVVAASAKPLVSPGLRRPLDLEEPAPEKTELIVDDIREAAAEAARR